MALKARRTFILLALLPTAMRFSEARETPHHFPPLRKGLPQGPLEEVDKTPLNAGFAQSLLLHLSLRGMT